MGILDKVFGKKIKVPVAYDSKFHYNCFIETVRDGDRQGVYQELRRRGLIRASHVLPDGRLQLAVRNISAGIEAYNAMSKDKVFVAGLTKARMIELMVKDPDMEVTVVEKTANRDVLHAEKIALRQIVVDSEEAFRKGVAHQERKQYQQAVGCYDEAIRIEPEDVRAWHNKIVALASDGKHQAAIEVANEILGRHANVAFLWEAKGRTLGEMGQVIEAGECMSIACELDPAIAKRHEARFAPEDKRFQALLASCRKLGKNPETDVDFWFGKFTDFVNAGDAEGTQICLHMAAVSGPDHYLIYTEDSMGILPPGHPLLSKGPLPEGAKVERLKDYFQRMVVKIKDKRPTAYLKDENKEVHTKAIRTLGEIGEPAIGSLIEALKDENKEVHIKAIRTLGEIGEPAIGSLIEAFKDENNEVCDGIMATLKNIGEPAVNPLIMAIKDENEKVRYYAAMTLGIISKSVAVNPLPLIVALRDENKEVQSGAIYALGVIGKPAVEPLIRALKDENMKDRVGAAYALGKIGEPAIDSLIKALKDENEDVRKMAVVALGETGDAQAREYLSQALTDESETFREFAKAVLEMTKAEKS